MRSTVTKSLRWAGCLGAAMGLVMITVMPQAQAASYTRITGEGSSWAGLAWADFTANASRQGVTVDYSPVGSSQGRDDFARQTQAMFADSEIPFTGNSSDPDDHTVPPFAYAMLPIVAGGTAFMYNLPIGGSQFSSLQLDMPTIAKIFAGEITNWNDQAIAATNPGVTLPNHSITVVVRSDGSGATAQFKLWMQRQYPNDYAQLINKSGASGISYFPVGSLSNFVAQNGSTGSSQYVANTAYTINYDEYAYASEMHIPAASVKNAAGYYTQPTADAVAVALIAAKIDTNKADQDYLSQDLSNVYTYGDPRAYPMSMYSYEIVPHATNGVTSTADGASIAWTSTNALCEWQRDMAPLGYSPLPMNLVLAGFDQLEGVPGIDSATQTTISNSRNGVLQGGTNPCNNPTFQPGDDPSHNLLVDTAPFPSGCDAACQAPWKQAGRGTNSGPSYGTGTGTTAAGAGGSGSGGSGGSGSGSGSGSTGGSGSGAAVAGSAAAKAAAAAAAAKSAAAAAAAKSAAAAAAGQNGDAANGAQASSASASEDCDPVTGICTSSDDSGTSSTDSKAKSVPMTLADVTTGWSATRLLALIACAGMLVALILGPSLVNVWTRRPDEAGDGS